MKLPLLVPSSFVAMPPLHAWADPIKRTLLTFAVVMVFVVYLLLAGGIIAFLVMLAVCRRSRYPGIKLVRNSTLSVQNCSESLEIQEKCPEMTVFGQLFYQTKPWQKPENTFPTGCSPSGLNESEKGAKQCLQLQSATQ